MTAEQQRLLLHIRRIAAGLLAIAAVAGAAFARDFLLPAVFAFFIATTMRPLVRAMSRRGIPAWATTAGIVLVAAAILGIATSAFAGAISQWIADAPRLQQELMHKLAALRSSFDGLIHISDALQQAAAPANSDAQEVVVKQPMLPTVFTVLAGYPLNVIFVASGAIVIAVFLMASGDLFYEKLIRVMPTLSDKKAALAIALDVEREVSAYLLSITLINAGLAVAVGLAFWLIGLPTPHLWALFAFVLNFIPYLGPITGLAVSALIGFVVFDTLGHALLAPLAYGILIGLETQIITPAVLSRRMEINAVMILLALAFWAWCWGIAGIVVAVPILVSFRVLCAHVEALAPFGEFLAQRHSAETTTA
ncbi:AI-2E family transporter [Aestuariivirga litoralis]|uniref:AI-2E family transporter n=1 Tax=Aestuariivirga litoralis TaxID=2650924 RepID=UPI0013799B9A|nr:AI-2E family transporter [Aestuariivirga litoralis]